MYIHCSCEGCKFVQHSGPCFFQEEILLNYLTSTNSVDLIGLKSVEAEMKSSLDLAGADARAKLKKNKINF